MGLERKRVRTPKFFIIFGSRFISQSYSSFLNLTFFTEECCPVAKQDNYLSTDASVDT